MAQTEAFAKHVTQAHSWYKDLPAFPPGELFAFFLDPELARNWSAASHSRFSSAAEAVSYSEGAIQIMSSGPNTKVGRA